MRQTGRQPILTVSRVHKILEFPPEKDEINNLVDLELIQETPKGRLSLFHHFIDMRTTVNLSISCL